MLMTSEEEGGTMLEVPPLEDNHENDNVQEEKEEECVEQDE